MDNNFFNNDEKKEIAVNNDGLTEDTALNETENTEGKLDDSNLSDDFVIGQDFFIDSTDADNMLDEEVAKKDKRKRKKRATAGKSCLTSIIWMAAIFFVAIGAASVLLYFGSDYLGVSLASDATDEKAIIIEQGTSAKKVADILEDAGVIKSSMFFRFYAKTSGYDNKFQYGVYYFCKQDSYEDIAEALTEKGALADEVQITIQEGLSIDEIADKMEQNGVCTADQFKRAVNEADKKKYNYEFMSGMATQTDGVHYNLEGYLFPDTYRFYATGDKSGAEQAIKKMLEAMDKKLTDNGLYDRAKELNMTIHDVLTMASMIELEAGSGEYADKQGVSAVFWNRLNNWEGEAKKLQSDPTSKYPYNTDSYDTYKIVGLAPGGYCAPGLDSIKAVLYPTENSKHYFFVTDKNGKFYFNETNSQHNKTIRELKNKGLWLETTR